MVAVVATDVVGTEDSAVAVAVELDVDAIVVDSVAVDVVGAGCSVKYSCIPL